MIDILEGWGTKEFILPLQGYYFTNKTAVLKSLVVNSNISIRFNEIESTDERYDFIKRYGTYTLRENLEQNELGLKCLGQNIDISEWEDNNVY